MNSYMRDLGNLAGSRIQDQFVVISKLNRNTRKGKPYWQLVLADSSGQIAGRIWNNFDHAGRAFDSGHVLEIAATVEIFGGELQLNIEKFRRLSASEFELSDLPTGTTGETDDFAELTEFEIAAGVWVMTDANSELALKTRQAADRFTEKYLNPSENKPCPQEKDPKADFPRLSRTDVDAKERKTKLEEFRRRYLSKTPRV